MFTLKINKLKNAFPLFLLITLVLAAPSTQGNEFEQRNANRITIRGQVDMIYIITEQGVLIPVKDTRHGYISLDLEAVDRDKVSIQKQPATGLRLFFKGDTENEKFPLWKRVSTVGTSDALAEDGKFEIEIELNKEIKSIYIVLPSAGVRSEIFDRKEKVFRVFGFHELELEEDKKTYEVDIAYQALLPSKFSGVVQNIADGEDINASVRHTAKFNGQVFSRGTSRCADDGSFEMTIPPLDGAEVEALVRGLSGIEFDRQTMVKSNIALRQIKEAGLVVNIQKRPIPSIVLELEVIDSGGNILNLKRSERQNYFIGFLVDNVKIRDNLSISSAGTLWQSAGSGKVYYWDLAPGEKHLLARYMMEPRKIIPQTIEIKDLAEEDRPQLIKVKIVHEP